MDDKIKSYDELNDFEKKVIDSIRRLQLEKDFATFSLLSFQLDNLITEYERLSELRKSIQLKYFTLFNSLKNEELVKDEININLWHYNRQNEDEIWADELTIILEIKNSIDEAIKLIESGKAEEMIIEKENQI